MKKVKGKFSLSDFCYLNEPLINLIIASIAIIYVMIVVTVKL